MFGKKDAINMEKVDTIIGKDSHFIGNIKGAGTIRVDGKIEGEVECLGDVVVGENGYVSAGLKARNLLVAGIIKGNVSVSGKLEIASSGRIEGDISTCSLIIDDGALFQGTCQMTGSAKLEKNKQAIE